MRMLAAAQDLTLDVIIRIVFECTTPLTFSDWENPSKNCSPSPCPRDTGALCAKEAWRRTDVGLAAINNRIDELVLPLIEMNRSATPTRQGKCPCNADPDAL